MKARVYIETLGCQMNVSDAERAKTRLLDDGYFISDSIQTSDVIIINTCSVRERAAQKVFTRIGEIRKSLKKRPLIGIMGCVAQLEGETLFDISGEVDIVVGTRAVDRISKTIESAVNGRSKILDLGEQQEENHSNVNPQVRHSPYIAFVPIIEGCNKFCTYCIVPYSRGRERSRLASDILKEVNQLRSLGYKEVHLIGQNVNSYRPKSNVGLEEVKGATQFSKLLRAVAATGMERIKFTTSFPRDFHSDIVAAIEENENLCNWIHLPVQSGSNRILRSMRRGYSLEDYLRLVDFVKSSKRRLALTSDIIVGFPRETEEDFEETVRLIRHCQYDSLYIFKYSMRPGTPAANLKDDVSKEDKAARFLALENIQKEIQRAIFNDYVGRYVRVLVEGMSKKSNQDMTGHTTCHKVVNFTGESFLAGQEVSVRITSAKANSLYGALAIGQLS